MNISEHFACPRSEIFSSNVLSAKEVADLHVQAAVVDCLDDFYSHSWRTSRFDKWATLMLYLNTPAGIAAMVGMAVLWCVLENASVVPALLVNHYDGFFGAEMTGMPIVIGYLSGLLFLFQWQRIRTGILGLSPRMSFLDKVCIDQEDEVRKSEGIASLGAFLRFSDNFVLLFSPEYFTRLWCCYELAAFHHIRDSAKQSIIFVPVSYPRVLFATALVWTVMCLPDTFDCLLGPLLGISQDTAMFYFELPGYLVVCYLQWECQRFVKEQEVIDAQIADFSIAEAECFDPKDRPRVYAEIAKWFGEGDEDLGIANFDQYVRTEIRQNMEELARSAQCFGAVLPFTYSYLCGCGAILEDIGYIGRIHTLPEPQMQTMVWMGTVSCSCIATPTQPNIQLWMAKYRFWGGWPMILLAPVVFFILENLLIVGSIPDLVGWAGMPIFSTAVVQFVCVLLFGAWFFRHSLRQAVIVMSAQVVVWVLGTVVSGMALSQPSAK